MPQDEDGPKVPIPPGIHPIFLTMTTQEMFKIKTDDAVTEKSPWAMLRKDEIMKDMQFRGAISDFHPARDRIKPFAGDEIMVVYDYDQLYGQNFYIVYTQDALKKELKRKEESEKKKEEVVEAVAEGGAEGTAPEPEKVRPRGWTSLGSESEVVESRFSPNRPLIVYQASRKRKEFGGPHKFSDRDALDSFLECRPHKDPNFDLKRMEVERGVQAVPEVCETVAQTNWFRRVQSSVQCDAGSMMISALQEEPLSPRISDFLREACSKVESALHENQTVQIFRDDFSSLGDDDTVISNKAENVFKEYQSFTHISYTKNKRISAIDWHPKQKGIIAIACMEPIGFEERVAASGVVVPAFAVVWNFADSIHPQYVLEAPFEVLCLRFNPLQPHLIAGGCANGQVCLWDTSSLSDSSKQQPQAHTSRHGDDDSQDTHIPRLRWSMISSIDNGHKRAVNDVKWLPDALQVDSDGVTSVSSDNQIHQFVSISTDRHLLVWDSRRKSVSRKGARPSRRDAVDDSEAPWVPVVRIQTSRSDGAGEIAGFRLSIDGVSRPCKFACTGEEGEIAFGDWTPAPPAEGEVATGVISSVIKSVYNAHLGPCVGLHRSPFFEDVYLTVGDWSYRVWRANCSRPLVTGPCGAVNTTCGRWSPTRPGVFFVGLSNGRVEVWDLTDRSHQPAIVQAVSQASITSIEFVRVPDRSAKGAQLVAIGDDLGTLHVLEVPRSLSRAAQNELNLMETFVQREVQRANYYGDRWSSRRAEYEEVLKAAKEAEKAQGEAPKPDAAPAEPSAQNDGEAEEQAIIEEFLKLNLIAKKESNAPPSQEAVSVE